MRWSGNEVCDFALRVNFGYRIENVGVGALVGRCGEEACFHRSIIVFDVGSDFGAGAVFALVVVAAVAAEDSGSVKRNSLVA